MTRDELAAKLEVIRENLERLEALPQGSYEEFASDFRTVDSALHRLQTTIQALMDLGSFQMARLGLAPPRTSRAILEIMEENGALPQGSTERFGPIFGFRNRIVHLYDRIDQRIVYRILRERRPDQAELCALLLDAYPPT